MSRITKWKIEKTKVKVVFRLQFHATHIPQSGWDKLVISFIPADSGKASAKTTKANVRNGICKWADPIYETTRLLQDIKTRQYDEKLYKFVVGMGSSRSSILGEANINLADFVDAMKPTTVALPLNGCEAGTTLHVTVQLLTSKTGFREFEQQRELRERGLLTTSDHGTLDENADSKESSPDQNAINHKNKVSAKVKFKRESKELSSISSHEGETVMNEGYADSAVGFDDSSITSESMYAENHNMSCTHEVDSLKSTTSGDIGGLSLSQSSQQVKGEASDNQLPPQGSDWVRGWSVDYSAASDLVAASEDHSRLQGSLEADESSILNLKLEVSFLQNQADQIGIETHKFAEQLAAEISSGEQLAKEVAVLKSECSKFKDDFEQLKISKLSFAYTIRDPSETNQDNLLQKSQIKWLKGLLLIEDNLKDIQTKVAMGFHERDIRFLNAELERLVEILQDLKQESGEAISGTNMANKRESKEMDLREGKQFLLGNGSDVDLFPPEGMIHYLSIPGLASHESDSIDPTLAMKEKIFELLRELDESKSERESLTQKMDQMECYYEALVQELEQNQRQMMGDLQNLRNEHAACLYTISSSETEMERMHQNMNEQMIKFAEDKHSLDSLNSELERRAISAETALKRARLNYSVAVGQLQKDLELLSCQVLSMYETNENLIKQAFSDPSLPSPEGCLDTVKYLKNSEEGYVSNQLLCQNQNAALNNKQLGEDILLKDLKRSIYLQEGLYKQVEEEVCQMHFVNLYFDVFSKALQETLLEVSVDIRLMKEKIDQLSQQLQHSTEGRESLRLKLQNAMDEIHSLSEYKASCTAKSDDIVNQKQILEANLKNLTHENHLLVQKINDLETLLIEDENYESKYVACNAENLELKNFLKKENQENDNLRDQISFLQEELNSVRTKYDELASMKDNLQNVVSLMSNSLQKLLPSHDDKYSEPSLCSRSDCWNSEPKGLEDLLLQLEELQHSASDRILQLIEEKKILMNEKHMAQVSLKIAESDNQLMKQKFENDLQEMVSNLRVSSDLLQKLKLEFEVIVNRLKAGLDAEEIYSQHHKELLSCIDHLEAEVHLLNSRNQHLAEEILRLDYLSSDLETCKMTLATLTEEKEALKVCLEEKTEESAKISSQLNFLKESLLSLQDELHAERTIREKLEKTVKDLTSELNEKQRQLLDFETNRRELALLKQLNADLELEKSKISNLLWQSDEHLRDVLRESSSLSCLETQFSELLEFSVATDVSLFFTRSQFVGHIEELVEQLQSTCRQLNVFQKKSLDVESHLNDCLSRESTHIKENARLLTNLDALKSELEASTAQSRAVIDQNSALIAELEEYKRSVENENNTCVHESQCALEVARLELLLASCSREVEDLFFSKEEVEVKSIIFQAKLDELKYAMILIKQSDDELIRLQNQCNELSKSLSEQVLKTEEFKNLSIHLKELKDKADAECLNARDRRVHEGSPVAVQESLRIVFIKEQYDTKLQELKQQLSVSRKHSEEMMWKLQDAIDEIENRKKSEASQIKTNEELGMKILDLEAELQVVLSEKRNLINAYDMVKAEKECSVMSLEYCKQEKQELEASLLKCNEEKSKIAVELTLTEKLIEKYRSHFNVQNDGNEALQKMTFPSDAPNEEKRHARNSIPHIPSVKTEIVDKVPENHSSVDGFSILLNPTEATSTCAACSQELESSHLLINMQPEDALAINGTNGCQSLGTEECFKQNEQRRVALNESLKSSMDLLNQELERMKNENLLPAAHDCNCEPSFPGLQRELMQLHEANQELVNIFPVFNEISASGNALERVLALEIELAEALQAKKKSSIHFQSSFLKQHSDEEAIFRSFRDINELIKDMLEVKGRHVAVETELKEMHERYSQLSLQFAEVEGERQKLMMTLKNNRAPRKALHSSTSSGDHSL